MLKNRESEAAMAGMLPEGCQTIDEAATWAWDTWREAVRSYERKKNWSLYSRCHERMINVGHLWVVRKLRHMNTQHFTEADLIAMQKNRSLIQDEIDASDYSEKLTALFDELDNLDTRIAEAARYLGLD